MDSRLATPVPAWWQLGEISKFCVSVHLETLFRNDGKPPFFMASIAMTGSPKILGHLSCWKLWFVKMPICSNLQLPICYVSQYVYIYIINIIYIYMFNCSTLNCLFLWRNIMSYYWRLFVGYQSAQRITMLCHVQLVQGLWRIEIWDARWELGCHFEVQCGQRTLSNMLCCFGAITFKNVANMGPWEVFKTTLCIAMALAVVMSLRL